MKEDKERCLIARDGDRLMVLFQCDICIFRNLQHRDPGTDSKDSTLMSAIRRVSLDTFWGREPNTVAANRDGAVKKYFAISFILLIRLVIKIIIKSR